MEIEKRMIYGFRPEHLLMLAPGHERQNTRGKAYSAAEGLVNASVTYQVSDDFHLN